MGRAESKGGTGGGKGRVKRGIGKEGRDENGMEGEKGCEEGVRKVKAEDWDTEEI